jgi:hypothetical protein
MTASDGKLTRFNSTPKLNDQPARLEVTWIKREGSIGVFAPIPIKKGRQAVRREADARELAILKQPSGRAHMEDYCRKLDEQGFVFPEKARRPGDPDKNLKAWQSGKSRLQNFLENERRDVWQRARKGVYINLPA